MEYPGGLDTCPFQQNSENVLLLENFGTSFELGMAMEILFCLKEMKSKTFLKYFLVSLKNPSCMPTLC